MKTFTQHIEAYDQYAKISGLFTEEELRKGVIEWLLERKEHFTKQHRYCDDVRKCMDHLVAELQSNENKAITEGQ